MIPVYATVYKVSLKVESSVRNRKFLDQVLTNYEAITFRLNWSKLGLNSSTAQLFSYFHSPDNYKFRSTYTLWFWCWSWHFSTHNKPP